MKTVIVTSHLHRHILMTAVAIALLPIAAFAASDDGLLEVTPLTDNVFIHTSYKPYGEIAYFPSNGLILVDNNEAVLVDTAWPEGDTPELVAWLENRNLKLKAAVVTHSHTDRTSGLAYLNELGIPTYASEATNTLLESAGHAQATRTFEDAGDDLRAFCIEVFFPGAGHAPDNHTVWFGAQKVLFGGCLVRSASTQNLGNTADSDIAAWSISLRRLHDRFPAASIVVPGHGAPGGRDLITHSIELASSRYGQ